ncbi:MAG: hypothetical protein R3F53_08160 [Gammaproteobacteria bacterium]
MGLTVLKLEIDDVIHRFLIALLAFQPQINTLSLLLQLGFERDDSAFCRVFFPLGIISCSRRFIGLQTRQESTL